MISRRRTKRCLTGSVAKGLNVLVVLAMILGTVAGVLTGAVKPGVAKAADTFEADSGAWTLKGSAYRYPQDFSGEEYRYSTEVTDEEYVVLTRPLGDQPQAGILWLNQEISSTFNASFRYMAGGGTGGEGLVFMFCKDRFSEPAAGGSLGFESTSGETKTGYGIEFDGYQNAFDTSERHVALVADNSTNHLIEASDNRTETEVGEWHWVDIDVSSADTENSTIRVKLDDMLVLKWTGILNTAYSGIGLAASTSVDNTNWYIVDDIQVKIRDAFVENTDLWNSLGSAGRDTGNLNVLLTQSQPDDYGVLWLNQDITSPFGVSFSYQMSGTGGDGLAFMFYKDAAYTPGTGGTLGFNPDGASASGYGVEFDGFDNGYEPAGIESSHVALITDNTTNHLASENLTMLEYQYDQDGRFVYDANNNPLKSATDKSKDGEWHWVRVLVGESTVDVWIDEVPVMSWTGTLDRTYGGIGFCAATGSTFQEHRIDNVVISVPELAVKNLHQLVEFLDRAKESQAPGSTDGYLWTSDSGASPGADGSVEEGSLNINLQWDDRLTKTLGVFTLSDVPNGVDKDGAPFDALLKLGSPTVTLSPSAGLKLSVGNRVKAEATLGGRVDLGCNLEATIHGTWRWEEEKELYQWSKIFVQWADYVPIEEEVCFTIYAGVKADVTAQATVRSGIDAWAQIDLKASNWNGTNDLSATPTFGAAMRPITWDASVDGNLRVFAGARLELLLYSFAGVKFQVEPYAKVHARLTGSSEASSDFSWDWGAGVDLFAGLTARGIGDFGKTWTFPFFDPDPSDARGVVEVLSPTVWPESHVQHAPDSISDPTTTQQNPGPYPSGYPFGLSLYPDNQDEYVGHCGQSYTLKATANDLDSDKLQYTFNWGDGSAPTITGWVPSGTPGSASHVWNTTGDYGVTVSVKDEHGGEFGPSGGRTVHIINNKPNQPGQPTSSVTTYETIVGQNMDFASLATDNDQDQLRLTFDWGDDSTSPPTGLYPNNTNIKAWHAWTDNATYTVKTTATDQWGAQSLDPSTGRDVTVKPNQPPPQRGLVSEGLDNQAACVAVDSSNNIFVGGFDAAGAWRVARYSSGGTLLGAVQVVDPGTGVPILGEIYSMAVNSQGDICVAGWRWKGVPRAKCASTAILDRNTGQVKWQSTDTSDTGQYNAALVTSDGRLVVGGKVGIYAVARVYVRALTGTTWVCVADRSIAPAEMGKRFEYSEVRGLAEDAQGHLLLCGSFTELYVAFYTRQHMAALWKWDLATNTIAQTICAGRNHDWENPDRDDEPALVSVAFDRMDDCAATVLSDPLVLPDRIWQTLLIDIGNLSQKASYASNPYANMDPAYSDPDRTVSVKVDSAGNIYVLGMTTGNTIVWGLRQHSRVECYRYSSQQNGIVVQWASDLEYGQKYDLALTPSGEPVVCGSWEGTIRTPPPLPVMYWGTKSTWQVVKLDFIAPQLTGQQVIDVPGTAWPYTATVSVPPGVSVKYRFDWGDGTDNVTGSTTAASWTLSHTWAVGGVYTVRVYVQCVDTGFTSAAAELVVTVNSPPETPAAPSGPAMLNQGAGGEFSVVTTDPNGDQVSYEIDWGDGTPHTVIGLSPSGNVSATSHTWASPGEFEVKVRATDEHGAASEWSTALMVTVNALPNADFTFSPDTSLSTGDMIQFTDGSNDPDGRIVSWAWDFNGDGVCDSTDQNPTYRYSDNGTYTVTLTVTDDRGAIATRSVTVEIANIAPVAGFVSLPVSETERNRIQFYGGTKLAVDGQLTELSYDTDGTIVAWLWDFGDGQTSTEPNPIHEYARPGTYFVTLTVTDDDGATATSSDRASPRPQLMMSAAIATSAAEQLSESHRQVMVFPPMANFTADPTSGYEPLKVTFTDKTLEYPHDFDIVSWEWDFGDGSPTVTWDENTYPAGGVILHYYTMNGVYHASLTVTDENGNTATRTRDIDVWKRPLPLSAVTSESGGYFDTDPNTAGQQFRLIFTQDPTNPSTYKLTASNPGQFCYNVFYLGVPGKTATLNIQIPSGFVTQGAVPVHVYSSVSFGLDGSFLPGAEVTGFSISGTGTITVQGTVPASGLVYIRVHLDFGLKGTVGYTKDLSGNAIAATGRVDNYADWVFSVSGDMTDSRTVENQNVFKRNPGFAGIVTDGSGDPMAGVQVKISSPTGKLLATVYTDEDGFYTFYYKHTGKVATYTVVLPAYSLSKAVTVKANAFVEVSFTIT